MADESVERLLLAVSGNCCRLLIEGGGLVKGYFFFEAAAQGYSFVNLL